MAESFDAVLAEMLNSVWVDPDDIARLQSAHEAEVAEVRESARHEAVAMGLLADRAVALLQRWASTRHYTDLALLDETDAFLSEQVGERDSTHED